MNINKKLKIHSFHFVLNSKLKNNIIGLSAKLKLSNSETAIYILNETLCILNKYQFDLQENTENLNYQNINWDEGMHIYMNKILYRKIKHLSDTVFSFSVAIVIRKLLELYFKILEKSNGNIERVKTVFKRFYIIHVKKYGNNKKKWNKKITSEQLYGKFYYYLSFNDKFTLTGFNFINSF